MKNNHLSRRHEAARIYQQHYRPSLNPLRLLKSVLTVFLTGHHPAMRQTQRHK